LENNDYGVAYEVFVHDYYHDRACRVPESAKLVVDLGANVGFSLLYFLHKYRHCRIIAFEPHPCHCAQAERNLVLDGSRHRVELYPQAAGAETRMVELSDDGPCSSIVESAAQKRFSVETVDIFPLLTGRRIDLLKMDIEGGEYEILDDNRFAQLDVGAIVMEWHSRGGGPDDQGWCHQRLRGLGYVTEDTFTTSTYGMLWAKS
jgi:FkbM family methyltransferase